LNFTLYRAYNAELGRWISRDPLENAEEIEGANLYAYVANNSVSATDRSGLLSSQEAFDHYRAGSGTPLRMSFSEIDTSDVSPSQFPKVRSEISGSARDATIVVDDRMGFSTSGGQALFLGNITLRLQGTLTLKKSECTWKFEGTLKSYDDYYDFNPANRGIIGEALTAIGRNTKGKSFWIEIRGSKQISESGKMASGR
jgi:uncharacterized protein RhaS with RHS repeats